MTQPTRKWQLLRGGVVIADIEQNDSEFPWFHGVLLPTPAFVDFAPLFQAAQVFAEREEFDTPESEAAFVAIDELHLSIRNVQEDTIYNKVMLNVTGSDISWRCHGD